MSLHVVRNQTFFKADMTPVKVERHNRKAERKKALDDAYEVVNKRDGNVCRATGRRLDPAAIDPADRREHHHLKGRNVRPDWRERPERICLVSALAHDLITRGWIAVEGVDARKPLFFHWTSLAKSRPLMIKRQNTRPE